MTIGLLTNDVRSWVSLQTYIEHGPTGIVSIAAKDGLAVGGAAIDFGCGSTCWIRKITGAFLFVI